jgi:nuclear pore complex protein Nup205
MESLARLQELYEDLTTFSEGKLAHVERLTQELESSIQDFRHLLDKSSQNNASRETLGKGSHLEGRYDKKAG